MSDKNGPMGRPDLKPCPRQCTVWPNAWRMPSFTFGSAPSMSVIERTSKDVCSAPMTVGQFVCSHSPCADVRQFLTNPFGKHTKFADECSFGVHSVYVYAALHRVVIHEVSTLGCCTL